MHLHLNEGEFSAAMSAENFRIDACLCGSEESLLGYPKYAADQLKAHEIAEQTAAELQSAGTPGEYFVVVSLHDNTPVATQVVVVPLTSNTQALDS